MKFSKIKLLIGLTFCAICQLSTNAQPGVLDIVLKTANNYESILVEKHASDIVCISIFNKKNQIVYTAKHSLLKMDKIYCELPKGIYTVMIANVNKPNRVLKYKINLD